MQFLTEPEPERGIALPVRPGIRRVVAANPGPMTYWGTNTYLVDMPGGVAVLDPGPDDPAHVAHVLDAAGAPIRAILLTHTHQDHVGAAPALRAATGAPLYAWHDPAEPALNPDLKLQDGDVAGDWQAVFTPGHAADHLAFAGPEGIVFSGDHVMGWSTTVVSPPGGNMADYLASLRVLLARPAAVYLPGHGPPITEPLAFVEALLAHRTAREAAIRNALEPGPQSVRDIAARLYPDVSPALRRAAERSVTAHLLKLKAEGQARESEDGWRRMV